MNNVVLDVSRPKKCAKHAFISAVNARFRAECLNAHWIQMIDDAKENLADRP